MSAGGRSNNGTRFRAPLSLYTDTKSTTVPVVDASGLLVTTMSQATVDASALLAAGIGHFSALRVGRALYDFSVDGGVTGLITPVGTIALPAKAMIIGVTAKVVAAVTSLGSATLAIGTSAGSAANSLLTATAKASLTLAALINGAATFAAPVQLSAAGNVTFTVGTADLTAGKVEVAIYYSVFSN